MKIFAWLRHNKEWVFSGAGVALIIFAVQFFISRKPQTPAANMPVTTAPVPAAVKQPQRASDVTPQRVFQAREAAAPFARDSVAEQFIGTPIDWTVEFASARKLPNDEIYVLLKTPGTPRRLVDTTCQLEGNEFLRYLHEDSIIRLTGKIAAIESISITVSEPTLEVLKSAEPKSPAAPSAEK